MKDDGLLRSFDSQYNTFYSPSICYFEPKYCTRVHPLCVQYKRTDLSQLKKNADSKHIETHSAESCRPTEKVCTRVRCMDIEKSGVCTRVHCMTSSRKSKCTGVQ